MISLFLDTSSSYLNIAILKDGKVLKEEYSFLEKDLSKYALFNIKKMITSLSLKPNDIDEILCVNGPGSFTGLRVGVTIAKTYTWGLNKDLYSVSSLYVMTSSITGKDYIIPIIDARRNYFFAAIYDKNYNVILKDSYIKKEELLKEIEKLDGSYSFISTTSIKDIDTILYKPNILNMYNHLKKEKVEPHLLVPNYLKKTEAEENLSDKGNK